MSTGVERTSSLSCEEVPGAKARWNLAPAALYEEAIRRGEGMIAADGPHGVPDRGAHRPIAQG